MDYRQSHYYENQYVKSRNIVLFFLFTCVYDSFLLCVPFLSVSFSWLSFLWRLFFQFFMAVFYNARTFNGDLSKWQTSAVADMTQTFFNSGFTRTLCGGAWESLTGSDADGIAMNAFSNLGSSTARYGCCPIGSFMSNTFVAPFSEVHSCTACPSNALTTVINDDITCNNNVCPTGMVYLDSFYGCVMQLPNGNGCPYDGCAGCVGGGCSRKSTDNTLNSILDRWLDTGTRSAVEAIYGPIGDWDVSLVKNFAYLFFGGENGGANTEYELKRTFNTDISKWNVVAAETMQASEF